MPDLLTKSDVREDEMVGETITYDEWDVTAKIADADGLHYGKSWRDDAALLKFGSCSNCGSDLVSWAKQAICSECEQTVSLT